MSYFNFIGQENPNHTTIIYHIFVNLWLAIIEDFIKNFSSVKVFLSGDFEQQLILNSNRRSGDKEDRIGES